jgi:hypothetical protein
MRQIMRQQSRERGKVKNKIRIYLVFNVGVMKFVSILQLLPSYSNYGGSVWHIQELRTCIVLHDEKERRGEESKKKRE